MIIESDKPMKSQTEVSPPKRKPSGANGDDRRLAGILTLDASGYVESSNVAMQHLYGDICRNGQHVSVFFQTPIALGNTADTISTKLTGSNPIPVKVTISPLTSSVIPQGYAVLVEAISTGELLNNRTFLAALSHELRTPLNSVLGFSQILRTELSGEQAESVEMIEFAGQHLLALTDQLLAMLQPNAAPEENEAFSTETLAKDCVRLMTHQARARGISLHIEPNSRWPVIRQSRLRMQQVLINFLSNAIKYNRANGHVHVRGMMLQEAGQPWFRLAVRDTGFGIENGSDDAVFEPFVRLEQSKMQASGLGLGLSICQEMAKLLGGRIGYVSEPGASTTFWIEIPVSPPVRDTSKK
ncbi:MAG: HAMP domain-containing sensor histidine kinase [Thalassolituus sp.]|uniref:histidine kinase n=2 Tax=Oceanospirillaceae TaxID=135620 RepID=M5DSU5_9GAMM|nr:HAMP domain-containing sensor histidine kinase [Thalassolituus oleivorans]AHK17479.1 hypothetical protein R615_06880 [Thalassolituus oleivorans R6-15]MBQ0728037.1 HAMP domain-containing histidine kinase [Thalassolituus oleivorans]CCU72563.1 hypothetical protein TOL_2158 [Thalassolituus oleivorans MIL-1]